jgi:hypothetical protein
MNGKYTRRIIEVIAWIIFLGFPLIVFPMVEPFMADGMFRPVFAGVMITHSLLIVFYYLNFYIFIPKFFFTRRYPPYYLCLITYVVLLIFLLQANPHFNPFNTTAIRFPGFIFIATIVIRFIMIFLLSLGFAHIGRLQATEKQQLQTELSFLKAQINPHFLFNTLNSIYALTVKKSDAAPESVTKLADIMRYIITDAASDVVPLEKEITYVSAYIDLERLRLTSKVKLSYTVEGDTRGKKVAPLVFIPLVENAFKHGVSTSENSEIIIRIIITDDKLELFVTNTKTADHNHSNGLGIANVKRRLELLYPGKYLLNIRNEDKTFSANLVMVLA